MIPQLKRLSLGLALALTALASPALAGDLATAIKYVPANFTTMVAFDVDHVRGTPLFELALANMGEGEELEAFKTEVGVDVTRDVKSFIFAGPDDLMRHSERFIAIVEAKVDPARFLAFAKKQGDVTEKKVRGTTLLVVDEDELAFAFDGDFMIFGLPSLVEQALAAKGGKNITSGRLAAMTKQVRGSKSGFAVLGAGERVKRFLGDGMVPEFSQLERAAVGLDLSSGFSLRLFSDFANDAAATAVADTLNQALKEMADDPEMKELGLDRFVALAAITARGKAVSITLTLDGADTKGLMGALEKMQ